MTSQNKKNVKCKKNRLKMNCKIMIKNTQTSSLLELLPT